MKVLCTGGAGYKGVKIAEALLARGIEVTILDNFTFGFVPILHLVSNPKLKIVRMDIRDNIIGHLKGHDMIIHLAGLSGFPACVANPVVAQEVNVEATKRLVASLSTDQTLIFASTTAMYEVATDAIVDEDTILNPTGIYTRTKFEGEKVCLNHHRRTIAFRVATVMGVAPRMRSNLLVNDFVNRAISDRSLVLYYADAKRTFIHVDDCVRGYMMAIDKTDEMIGQVFNLGSEQLNFSKRQVAEEIQKRVNCDIIFSNMPDRDSRNFTVSFEKVRRLGFDTRIDLAMTIEELVKLYRFYRPDSYDDRLVY